MRRAQLHGVVVGVAAALLTGSPVGAQETTGYLTPPPEIVDILDAPPIPQVVVSPRGDTVALLSRPAMPSIAELAQPMLRLAGYRLNPRTNGPQRPSGITRITLKGISDGAEHAFDAPRETSLGPVEFSPDGSRLIFTLTRYNGIEVWLMEVATGDARPLSDASINAAWGDPCDWLDENATVICTFKASARGAPPAAPHVPAGPKIQEHNRGAAPNRPNQDQLGNPPDRTSRNTAVARRRSAPTRTCWETRTTKRCSSTTSRARSPRSTSPPAAAPRSVDPGSTSRSAPPRAASIS